MEIDTWRKIFLETRTIGEVTVNGSPFCYSLEDTNREPEREVYVPWEDAEVLRWKIPHVTCIPAGRFRITLELSPRFGIDTITFTDPRWMSTPGRVPGYTSIRAHAGNKEADTDGCTVLGFKLTPNMQIKPGTTHPAVDAMKFKIKQAIKAGELVWWSIHNVIPKVVS